MSCGDQWPGTSGHCWAEFKHNHCPTWRPNPRTRSSSRMWLFMWGRTPRIWWIRCLLSSTRSLSNLSQFLIKWGTKQLPIHNTKGHKMPIFCYHTALNSLYSQTWLSHVSSSRTVTVDILTNIFLLQEASSIILPASRQRQQESQCSQQREQSWQWSLQSRSSPVTRSCPDPGSRASEDSVLSRHHGQQWETSSASASGDFKH